MALCNGPLSHLCLVLVLIGDEGEVQLGNRFDQRRFAFMNFGGFCNMRAKWKCFTLRCPRVRRPRILPSRWSHDMCCRARLINRCDVWYA